MGFPNDFYCFNLLTSKNVVVMSKYIFTDEQLLNIKENYLKMSSRKLAELCKCDRGVIQRFLKKNNLVVPKKNIEVFRKQAMIGRTSFTEIEDNYIKENYLKLPIKTMGSEINRSYSGISGRMKQLNLVLPKELIEKRKKACQFKKGQTPFTKGKKQTEYMSDSAIERTKATRFKKGSLPHNYKNGEHLTKDGYVMLSLGESKTRLKHVYEWEKINGKLPKGHCLACLDGDKTNTNPKNWKLITRVENMYNNSKMNYPKEIIPSLVLINKISKSLNKIEDGTK